MTAAVPMTAPVTTSAPTGAAPSTARNWRAPSLSINPAMRAALTRAAIAQPAMVAMVSEVRGDRWE